MNPGTLAVTAPTVGRMAQHLQGNQILRIAYEVRQLKAEGHPIADLTIGDFYPGEFGLPLALREGIARHVLAGHTNYPTAMGLPELREAVAAMSRRDLGLNLDADQVVVGSGTRPLMYAAFQALLDPGDTVVYGLPSWNNNHYCHIVGAHAAEIVTRPEHNFMPLWDDIEAFADRASLLVLTTPANPSGTLLTEKLLKPILQGVLAENRRREHRGRKPLYVLFDQVYWRFTYDAPHVHPVQVLPEMAAYTLYMDGASKNYGGTGIRVGWALLPKAVVLPITNLIGHMGAWAPKAEQLALAEYMADVPDQQAYFARMGAEMHERLKLLHSFVKELEAKGLPVRCVEPQGAMFLSMQFDLVGWTAPTGSLRTHEDVRRYLLLQGQAALVPFDAFGDYHNVGWYRASVSGLPRAELEASLHSLRSALLALQPPPAR